MPKTLQKTRQLELSLVERETLKQCEEVIKRGIETFIEVGNALLTIRDQRLYRAEFSTFDEYCRERWTINRAHAYRLIDAAEVAGNLSPIGDIQPTNESQVRPLVGLPPEVQQKVWTEATITAPDGKVTAAHVELVARGEREILQKAKEIRSAKSETVREKRVENIVEISKGNKELATVAKYPVILCDPPWRYQHSETESRAVENQYPTMALEDICAMPLADITTPDCIVFMWATSPKLSEAIEVLKAWGLTYKTNAVWVKDKIGMGYYFRQQHELLLVATKGNPPTPKAANRLSSVIEAARNKHSAKPVIVHEMIEGMYPEFEKAELFCRSPRKGWHAWGNQC